MNNWRNVWNKLSSVTEASSSCKLAKWGGHLQAHQKIIYNYLKIYSIFLGSHMGGVIEKYGKMSI